MCSDCSPDVPPLILDVGCGSGLSGEILSEEGHLWIGMDIAPSMLGQSQIGS
jgi:18S rRNA (guanine1575-N7)-methyltransferase